MEFEFVELLWPIIASAIWAANGLINSWWRAREDGTFDIDFTRLLSTLVVGLVVGIVILMTGVIPTQELVIVQLTTYGFLIAIIDKAINSIRKTRKEVEPPKEKEPVDELVPTD